MSKNTRRFATITAAVAVGLSGALAPAQAAPQSSKTAAPALTKATVRADMDGDGKTDTLTLAKTRVANSTYYFTLSVRTATGRRASTVVQVPREVTNLAAKDVLVGVAEMDGARGAEVIVDRSGGVGDWPYCFVYTMRKGKLVLELAPGSRSYKTHWSVSNHPAFVSGYQFSTSGGVRRVIVTRLTAMSISTPDKPIYEGFRTTYRWGRTGWMSSGTKRMTKVPNATAEDFSGFNGLTWR